MIHFQPNFYRCGSPRKGYYMKVEILKLEKKEKKNIEIYIVANGKGNKIASVWGMGSVKRVKKMATQGK